MLGKHKIKANTEEIPCILKKWKTKDGAWDDIILDIYIKDITEAEVTRKTCLCVDIYYSIYTLIIHCISCKR